MARDDGPIGVMLREHDIGLSCIKRMEQTASSSSHDAKAFALAANEYISLLRQHISKENDSLYQIARWYMSDDDVAETLEKFRSLDQNKGGEEFHQQYEAEIEDWEEAFAK